MFQSERSRMQQLGKSLGLSLLPRIRENVAASVPKVVGLDAKE